MKNKQLKIVQTPARYHPYIGGVEKYVFDLSNQLVKKNNSVLVICADEPKTKGENQGIKVTRLGYIAKIANTNITPFLFVELLKNPFDLIHTHMPTPWSADISMLVAGLKSKPLVVTYHNDIQGKGMAGFIARLYSLTFLKILLKRASAIIVTQKKYIKSSRYLSNFTDKITVIPNGVDTSAISDLGLNRKANSIFFLSSLDKYHSYKGLSFLLQSIAIVKISHPDVELIIGGDGELIHEYKRLTRKLDIESNVKFLGRVDENEKNKFYQESSMFVLPSNGIEEGFGIVLLEAMANKTPVITTRYAGVADDILQYEAGFVVQENNSDELAKKISFLLSNPALVSEMGRNGHVFVNENYSWEKVAEKITDLYAKII